MERMQPSIVDLAALERTLVQRACWHEDPAAYRQGVHDTVEELRRAATADHGRAEGTVAV